VADARKKLTPFILAAGEGTRLRPLTTVLPKPLVPLGLSTPLHDLVGRLQRAREVVPGHWTEHSPVANAYHLGDRIVDACAMLGVRSSTEKTLLGTAGGVAHARALLGNDDVLVWNADIRAALDPNAVAAQWQSVNGSALLVIVAAKRGEGNVGVDADGRIVRLRNVQFSPEISGGYFTGVHVISQVMVAALPQRGCLVGDVYLPALAAGATLFAAPLCTAFADIGTLGEYLAANIACIMPGFSQLTAPDAVVSAPLTQSIVGADARVDAPLSRVVVWPGTHVREPLQDAIATPHGIYAVATAISA
jgi:mannose-1-phosphate guanylyltransferase